MYIIISFKNNKMMNRVMNRVMKRMNNKRMMVVHSNKDKMNNKYK